MRRSAARPAPRRGAIALEAWVNPVRHERRVQFGDAMGRYPDRLIGYLV